LAGGNRIFALAMIKGAAELRNQPFAYTVEAATGTASLLAAPPTLEPEQI